MDDKWLHRLAQVLTLFSVIISIVSVIWLFSAAEYSRFSWLEIQVRTIVNLGAPVLGLIIVRRQPHQRIGWLWLILGMLSSFRAVGIAIFYGNDLQSTGYSALEYFFLWFSEATNLVVFLGQVLLLLWFPDGQLTSRRWRLLYLPLFIGFAVLSLALFVSGSDWNGGARAAGVVINNPYGWLPADLISVILPPAFLTLVLSMIVAAVSLIFRYRSTQRLVRYQIRWFMLGGLLFVVMNFAPIFSGRIPGIVTNSTRLLYVIAFSNAIPLYLAVGLAILRYRLYDIDVIIRKTLVYAALSTLLALVYFGTVILLQSVFDTVSGQQSPLVIVLSTLVIAALFTPLRKRIQALIDRRFFRLKYDAQLVLTHFAQTARDELELEELAAEMGRVVQETMQPKHVNLWIKQVANQQPINVMEK